MRIRSAALKGNVCASEDARSPREPVYIAEGEFARGSTGDRKNLAGYRWFESISLQRRVHTNPIFPTDLNSPSASRNWLTPQVALELAWAPNVLTSMDYTYRERHGEAIYRFKGGMLPSDFFRRNVVLSFQEDAIGIRLRDVIGVDNMMWGSDYPHSESTFPQSRKILAEILAGVPDDEQAKIAGGNTARVYSFDTARLTVPA